MADYRACLANLLFTGAEFTTNNGHRWRNLLRLNLGGFDVELVQRPECMPSTSRDFKGQTLHTTDLVIRDLPAARFQAAQDLARDVAELLMFATSSEVVAFGYEFSAVTPPQQWNSIVAKTYHFRPALQIRSDASETKHFLEQTFNTYQKLRSNRCLNIAFEYYLRSQLGEQPVELQLITTFVMLENLKTSFARLQGYPFIKGYFRKLGSTSATRDNKLSFNELLTLMFNDIGMHPSLQQIIKLRNDLLHTGLTTLDFHQQWQMLESSLDIVREYLLRLLGFHGHFSSFSMKQVKIT